MIVVIGSVIVMVSVFREKWGFDWRVFSRCWLSIVGLGFFRMFCYS